MGKSKQKHDDIPELFSEGICEDCCEVNYNGNDTCACCCPNTVRHAFASLCDTCLQCLESPTKLIFGTINILLLLVSTACSGFTITILIQSTDNSIRDFFSNSNSTEGLFSFSDWPIVSLLQKDRLLLDILVGISSLTILLSIFGLLSISYRSFRPLLWIYFSIYTVILTAQLTIISYSILQTNDVIDVGWKIWKNVNPNTRQFIENSLDCCSFQNVATEYGKDIPEMCINKTIIEETQRYRETLKRPCAETVIKALKSHQTGVVISFSLLLAVEFFQIIACLILLSTRLPYYKHRQMNEELIQTMEIGVPYKFNTQPIEKPWSVLPRDESSGVITSQPNSSFNRYVVEPSISGFRKYPFDKPHFENDSFELDYT